MFLIIIPKIFMRNIVITKIFMRNVVITKIFIKNGVCSYKGLSINSLRNTQLHFIFLYLALILRNSLNNKFIKLVEQLLKLINYSWPYSESESHFSFAINVQCHILTLLLNLALLLNLNLILVQHLWIYTSVFFFNLYQ